MAYGDIDPGQQCCRQCQSCRITQNISGSQLTFSVSPGNIQGNYVQLWQVWLLSDGSSYLSCSRVIINCVLWLSQKVLMKPLQWRHNEHYGVSHHQRLDCLLNRLFMRRSKKTSNLRVTGLCEGNSPVTGGFSAQRASNAENVTIWWPSSGTFPYMRSVVTLWITSPRG